MKQKKFMMPPPPPLVKHKPVVEIVKINVDASEVRAVQNKISLQMAKHQMNTAVGELRADVAVTEMRQERYRLEREAEMLKAVPEPAIDNTEKEALKAEFSKIVKLVEGMRTIEVTDKPSIVIASLNGKKAHKPDCTVVARIPKEKRVSFHSATEAKSHDYTLCAKCHFPDGQLFASKEQNKVHLDACPAIKNINRDNLVPFGTKKEAFDLGFAPCKMCIAHAEEATLTVEVKPKTTVRHTEEMHASILQIA